MARGCPHCQSAVPTTAAVCSYCGRDLPPLERKPGRHWPKWQVVLLILVVFAVYFLVANVLESAL